MSTVPAESTPAAPQGTQPAPQSQPAPQTAHTAQPQQQPAQTAPGASPSTPQATPQDGYRAPWDREGETFDADRARRLLEARDADLQAARRRADELQRAEDERQRAAMTEQQRLEADLTAQREQAAQAVRERDALRVALQHGLGEDDLDLLGTGTPDELATRAQRLADLKRAAATQPPAPTAPAGDRRPVERLTPGASPTASSTVEDAYPPGWLPQGRRATT